MVLQGYKIRVYSLPSELLHRWATPPSLSPSRSALSQTICSIYLLLVVVSNCWKSSKDNGPISKDIIPFRTVDSLVVGYGKGKLTCFCGDPDYNIDLILSRMVVNTMIATMVAHSNEPECEVKQIQPGFQCEATKRQKLEWEA